MPKCEAALTCHCTGEATFQTLAPSDTLIWVCEKCVPLVAAAREAQQRSTAPQEPKDPRIARRERVIPVTGFDPGHPGNSK